MVILNFDVDNFYEFDHFNINLSYPKKLVKSSIPEEHLKGFPNFRYKKVVFVMGANATGKTTLGKSLMDVMNFINRKEYTSLVDVIKDPSRDASFVIDLAFDNSLVRVCGTVIANADRQYSSDSIKVSVHNEVIKENDSYESCLKRLLTQEESEAQDYIKELEKVPKLSWMYRYPMSDSEVANSSYKPIDDDRYLEILKAVLKVLDPRIIDVSAVEDTEETFMIKYDSRRVMIEKSMVISGSISSGTAESITAAQLIAAIKTGGYKFFYYDERFAHVHSDSEKAFVAMLISLLQDNDQLFITSHNVGLLDMDVPKHSFVFLKRNEADNRVECVYPSQYLKRNTDSLRNAVENDLFGASPNLDQIYDIQGL